MPETLLTVITTLAVLGLVGHAMRSAQAGTRWLPSRPRVPH